MSRRKPTADEHTMLKGLEKYSADWLTRYDIRIQHDLLHAEYTRLHSEAVALRDDPLQYDRIIAQANEVKRQRDEFLRQLIDLPEVAPGLYSAQTILPARRPSLGSRLRSLLHY